MGTRNIIVIGASAGGFTALKELIKGLPADLQASIFVVWHMPPDVTGILPQVLTRLGRLPAAQAVDGEPIKPNRIYVARPDHHLLVEDSHVRVTKGPKENRFRPAVDPLFRSAAYAHGRRVIGVILSGALDDGTSGLWMIKRRGGAAVVQDPADAEFPSMPGNALREVEVDYKVPISEMADLLVRLTQEQVAESSKGFMEEDKLTEFEIRTAAEDKATMAIKDFGAPTPFTCPECHGVLFRLKDGNLPRFRCHTGHAFSSDSLLSTVTESIEDSLWNALRCIEESVMLLNQLGEHFVTNGQANLGAIYFKKALEAEQRGNIVRDAVMRNERLSNDSLQEQAGEQGGSESEDTPSPVIAD
jgi:two-component system, chemotaxis family, protein-glutamate methylesterase/glutaminase